MLCDGSIRSLCHRALNLSLTGGCRRPLFSPTSGQGRATGSGAYVINIRDMNDSDVYGGT